MTTALWHSDGKSVINLGQYKLHLCEAYTIEILTQLLKKHFSLN